MERPSSKLLIDALAGAGAIGQVLISGWLIVSLELSASGLAIVTIIAVVAIGGAIGVWTENVPLAAFGSVLLYLHGFSQGASIGIPILFIATLIGLATYLEWRRQRRGRPT